MSVKDTLTASKGLDSSTKDYTELQPKQDIKNRSPSKVRQVLVLLSCCYLRCIASGPQYGLSVMYVDFIKHWQAPRKQASLVQSVFTTTLYWGSFIASIIIARAGPGVSVIVGSLIAVVGFLASAFLLNSLVAVIVCTGIVAGFGSAVMLAATWTAVVWSFKKNRAMCLVLVSLWSSIGSFIFPYIANVTLEHLQLKGTFIVLACMQSTAIAVGIFLFTTRHYFEKGDHSKASACNLSFLRQPLFWGTEIAAVLITSSIMDPYLLVDIVDTYGFGRSKGATAEIVFGIGGLFGKLTSIVFARIKRFPAITHWSYCCVVTAICHCLLPQFSHYWLVILVSAISGTSNGLIGGLSAPILLEIVGLEFFPRAQGMAAGLMGTSIFAGILFCGALKDSGWSYEAVYHILAGALLVASCLSIVVAVYTWKMKRQAINEEKVIEQ